MIKPYIGKVCPFCVSPLNEIQDVIFCFECKKPHHKECWQYNLNKCANFGCKGNKIDENYLKPSSITKNIAPVPIVIEPPQKIIKPEVKQLKLRVIKKTIKKNPVIIINKNEKEDEFVSVPKPTELPSYINDPLIKPDFLSIDKNKNKNFRKAFPLPVIKYPKKKNEDYYEPVPVPDFEIPDYVTEDLTKPEEPKVGYVPKIPEYLRLKIQNIQKKKEKDRNKLKILAKPERYVPDYVNLKEIPKKKKKKKIPQYYKPLLMYPPTPITHNDYDTYLPIEKPEAYIPGYVYTEIEDNEIMKKLLPDELLKSRNCIHCKQNFKIELLICPFCKKTQNKDDYRYLNYVKPKEKELSDNIDIVDSRVIFVNLIGLKSLSLHRNGTYLSFGCKDKNVRIWDLNKKQMIKELEGHKNYVNSVDFSPDGRYLASGSIDTTIRIWDVETGICKKEITGNPMGFNYIKYSPDGDYIISSSGEGMIKVWERFNGICVRALKADMSWVNLATFSPNMEFVCSCDADNMIRIWDIMDSRHIKTLVGHFDSVNAIVYSPDGRYLASASNDNTIKIWDLEGQEKIKNLLGHFDAVNSIDFSPDGRYLVSGSNDKTIKIWDTSTLKCVRNIQGHNAIINSVIYGHNGSYIISAGEDKTIRIWYLV